MTKYILNLQEAIIKHNGLGIQLKMKAIGTMPLVNWLDGHMLSQDLNLLDC